MRKEKFNLALPGPLKDEFDAVTQQYGERKKGELVSVAALLLLELSRDARDYIREELAVANIRGTFDDIIERAKTGALRREAESRNLRGRPELLPPPVTGAADPAEYLGAKGKRKKGGQAKLPRRKGVGWVPPHA